MRDLSISILDEMFIEEGDYNLPLGIPLGAVAVVGVYTIARILSLRKAIKKDEVKLEECRKGKKGCSSLKALIEKEKKEKDNLKERVKRSLMAAGMAGAVSATLRVLSS